MNGGYRQTADFPNHFPVTSALPATSIHDIPKSPIGSGDFAFGSKVWPGLAKLIEECGEKLQIAGKLMQRGGRTDHWSGDLKPMAEHEVADVIAAAEVFIELNADRLDVEAIGARVELKKATFRRWHHENLGNPAA